MVVAVRELAGLRHEVGRMTDPQIPADRFLQAADGDCGIIVRCKQDLRHHAGGGRLAVRAGDRKAFRIVRHHLPEQLRPVQDRDALFLRGDILRIVRMDRCGVHAEIDAVCNIFRLLADQDLSPERLQTIGILAFLDVRSGNLKALRQKKLRQAAHADAADAHEMSPLRMIKIYLIHIVPLFNDCLRAPGCTLRGLFSLCPKGRSASRFSRSASAAEALRSPRQQPRRRRP